ncbi:hypothetical protein PF005_g6874 [Phytophthora fragariae]|uniref:Uncharacterized protein n=1 Tax=Phytophthora fragariae TaxID=53985 RepID=A0A6A3ZX40_9STRA|nr:hypothetical protein PF003_g18221 [Phytophthora fragariae]KAE8942071.1 hypothetical protein PF009_g8162 [Phytophthora fragariae]KAE9025898.1 hypothetical protein PF011_g2822 [Phytophthora fragariae]KAE9116355.1 hypothetical protein PF010_g8992 [Phytophthora fragariae]KAE9119190.1 hypothetical protein PF007_g8642 [Phytophthora fragariae]
MIRARLGEYLLHARLLMGPELRTQQRALHPARVCPVRRRVLRVANGGNDARATGSQDGQGLHSGARFEVSEADGAGPARVLDPGVGGACAEAGVDAVQRQEHIVQCWRESREISFISLPIFHISQLICEVEVDAPRSMGSVLLILGQV